MTSTKPHRNYLLYSTAIFIFFGLLSFCHSGTGSVITYELLTKANMDSLIVARVGPIVITAKEFLISYEYGPAFVKRGKDSKKRFLNFMINEKLLALDGYKQGVQSEAEIKETLSEIEGDLATEELFKDDVMSKVEVPEEEIENSVAKAKIHLSLKWLFTQSLEDMKHKSRLLKEGISFDTLFIQQLNDSTVYEDRYLETSLFKLETKNPDLAKIVDVLPVGKVSHPISTPDGWYFIKIINSWTNALTTETEKMKLRYNVERALFKRKMDALSDQYVRNMMSEANPIIIRKTFNLLRAYIGEKILPPEKFYDWNLGKQVLEEFGPLNITDIEKHGDLHLVEYSQGTFKLEDFLIWYRTRESNIRFKTSSQKSFFVSLQQMVWRMVRDNLLVKRSYQRGLQNREIVKTQKQWWKEKILYSATKSNLIQSIEANDAQLREYYLKNKRSYRNRTGEVIPFNKAKWDVRRDYYSSEITKKLLHRILNLRQQYKVEIYEDILNRLFVNMENDSKAIDVYVVKKGGTFPRPAFPTIDNDWKNWY